MPDSIWMLEYYLEKMLLYNGIISLFLALIVPLRFITKKAQIWNIFAIKCNSLVSAIHSLSPFWEVRKGDIFSFWPNNPAKICARSLPPEDLRRDPQKQHGTPSLILTTASSAQPCKPINPRLPAVLCLCCLLCSACALPVLPAVLCLCYLLCSACATCCALPVLPAVLCLCYLLCSACAACCALPVLPAVLCLCCLLCFGCATCCALAVLPAVLWLCYLAILFIVSFEQM